MNRHIAFLSAALLLGAAPIAALAQSQTQNPAPSPAPQSSTTAAPPSSSNSGQNSLNNSSSSEQGMSGQNENTTGTAEKSPQDVQKVQQALNQNGEHVKVDGVWGPKTSQALRDYQQKNGLQASGQLDDQTMQKLNVASGE